MAASQLWGFPAFLCFISPLSECLVFELTIQDVYSYEKLGWPFLSVFSHFIHQTFNLIKKISGLIDYK